MTDNHKTNLSESLAHKRPYYKHRSAAYVPRVSDSRQKPAAVAAPVVTPYAAEISVLEAARLARERLPSAAPSPKHKTISAESVNDPDYGLVSDMAR